MWEFFGDLFMVSKQRWWGEKLLNTQMPIFFWLLKLLSRNRNPEETRNPLEAFGVSTQTQTQTQAEKGMKLVSQLCKDSWETTLKKLFRLGWKLLKSLQQFISKQAVSSPKMIAGVTKRKEDRGF
jgi:hypothetical protein